MKRFLITLVLMLTLTFNFNAYANNLSNFDYERIDSLHITIPSTIKIVDGDKFTINFVGTDSTFIKNVNYEVKDGTLYIRPKFYYVEDNMNELEEKLGIRITSPNPIKIGTGRHYRLYNKNYNSSLTDDSGNSTY